MAFERRQFLTTKNLSDNGLLGKDREILIDKTNKRVGYCDENGTLESMANVNELPDLSDYATKNFVTNLTGDLDNLATTDKSNLVAAINEAAQSGGGSGNSQVIALYVSDLTWTSAGNNEYVATIPYSTYGVTSEQNHYIISLYKGAESSASMVTLYARENYWSISIFDTGVNLTGSLTPQYGILVIQKTTRRIHQEGGDFPSGGLVYTAGYQFNSNNIYKINKTFTNPASSSNLGDWTVDPTTNLYKVDLPTTKAATASNLANFSGYWEDKLQAKTTAGLGTVHLPTLTGFTFPLGYKLELSISNGCLVATIWASAVPEVASIATANINLIIFGANQ